MTRRWIIRRYDQRLETIGDAIHHEHDCIEERECPDLDPCLEQVNNLMMVAAVMEETVEFAYALWVEDDGEAMPVYVLMRESADSPRLVALMTPDVSDLFDREVPAWRGLIYDDDTRPWE